MLIVVDNGCIPTDSDCNIFGSRIFIIVADVTYYDFSHVFADHH